MDVVIANAVLNDDDENSNQCETTVSEVIETIRHYNDEHLDCENHTHQVIAHIVPIQVVAILVVTHYVVSNDNSSSSSSYYSSYSSSESSYS